jgi:hypothetical protein
MAGLALARNALFLTFLVALNANDLPSRPASNARPTYVPSMLATSRQLRPESCLGLEVVSKVFATPSPLIWMAATPSMPRTSLLIEMLYWPGCKSESPQYAAAGSSKVPFRTGCAPAFGGQAQG